MEPPTKRPRFGPAPFEDEDPDEDELVSRPEDVNARRDPGLRFERSRAFAAYKLKSAFESIFEKYGKDFTGVGDEIELSTGKVVVNNGHLQSLKDAAELEQDDDEEEDDEEEDDDAASAPGAPNEQESANKELEESVKPQTSSMPQQPPPIPLALAPSYFGGGWPGMSPMMGYPQMVPNMMYPPPMPYGALSMPPQMPYGVPMHGMPLPMPTMDPAWQTPELSFGNSHDAPPSMRAVDATWQAPELPESAFRPKEPPATPKRKKARQSTTAIPEQDGTDMDDILAKDTEIADQGQGQEENVEESSVRKTVLLPRPTPEVVSGKKSAAKPKSRKRAFSQPKRRGSRSLPKKDAKTPTEGDQENDDSISKVQTGGQESSLVELTPSGINNRMTVNDACFNSQGKHPRGVRSKTQGKSLPVRSRPSRQVAVETVGSDEYIDLSGPDTKISKKPRNQNLRVEIVANGSLDATSFRAITPEPIVATSEPQEGLVTKDCPEPTVENGTVITSDINTATIPEKDQGIRTSPPVEVFTRNIIDTEYGFSDEDEPLPRRTRLNSQLPKKIDAAVTGLQESTPVATPTSTGGKGRGATSGRKDVELSSPHMMLPPSNGKNGRPRRISTRGKGSICPALEIPDSDPEGYISTQEELCEALSLKPSSPALPVEEVVEYRRPASPTLSSKEDIEPAEVVEYRRPASPTLSSKEEVGPAAEVVIVPEDTQHQHTVSSPILPNHSPEKYSSPGPKATPLLISTSPSKPSRSLRSRKRTSPSTPIKTPQQPIRKPKARPSSSKPKIPAPLVTTSAKRKSNILSLLSDSEDELSMMSPIPQNTTPTIRSSPASHHVRMFPSFPVPGSVSKPSGLKRDALLNSASKVAELKTPGSRRSKRREKGILGSASGKRDNGMSPILGTPSKSVVDDLTVQTPGGTVRRCGEDGFRCERDFCFGCL
ncbi:hypothetical protein QBC38DRAFT_465416 [Podospora fimiseda]|uniref:Myb-like DNA-binding domain protein n=1 Tax=Podospora fimiseda TaxID=252190 RepID=A0AAN7BY64_9PEZI|nr:hypothetical protein QBC38DRAFT_465416 [Podospora fimiseda]